MEVIVERPAALDVHNASVMACVRAPGQVGGVSSMSRSFRRRCRGCWRCVTGLRRTRSTGSRWRPPACIGSRSGRCLRTASNACWSTRATSSRSRAARPTSRTPQWLCQLLEAGLLRASLVPPKPIRTLRNLTSYRKSQIRDRQREMNRLHKVMQDTGIKLDCVATDMMGKSGRAMLDALVSGTTDPVVLADLARGLLRKKLPALQAALEGRFDAEHVADRRADPRAHRLSRRGDRRALDGDRGAARPFRAGR